MYHSWDDPSLAAQDSWPRALIDAAVFNPVIGKQVLRPIAGLAAALCEHELTWVIARKDDGEPLLKDAAIVAENALYALKRVERSKLACR